MSRENSALTSVDLSSIYLKKEIRFPESLQYRRALAAFSVSDFLRRADTRLTLCIKRPATCINLLGQRGYVILTKLHPYTSRASQIRGMAHYEFIGLTGDSE